MEPMDEDGHDTGNTIEIPVWQSEETVAINLDEELPEDPEELCTLLENEHSEPKYWLAVGIAYARKNQVASAIEVLNKGLNGKYFFFCQHQQAKLVVTRSSILFETFSSKRPDTI